MDPLPEEQQSQQGTPMNPTTYRSMRDHIHHLRVSAPSCIIPPTEDVAVRPYLVPLLPTFHGMENENPYTHIRDFEEVCITFKECAIDMDLLKLKEFPLTLKDKAKIWINSLRPRTIRSWAELQEEFLKKFFSAHKTNNLKRQIYTFAAHDNERFYQCWERFMETISACPHHGFDTWMLVNHFYGGMSPAMKQLLETMCGGDFLSKHPDEAMDFLNYVAEASKGWDEPNPREAEKIRPSAHQRGGIFALSEDMEMKARRLNLVMKDVVRKEVSKWLNAGFIYAISENPWVSPVHVVPKKGGFTVIRNERNELIPTRIVTGWRVFIDYRKLNTSTRKDHFPLPFIDQMLDRLVGHPQFCFLDGYSRYNQISIAPEDQKKTTFT